MFLVLPLPFTPHRARSHRLCQIVVYTAWLPHSIAVCISCVCVYYKQKEGAGFHCMRYQCVCDGIKKQHKNNKLIELIWIYHPLRKTFTTSLSLLIFFLSAVHGLMRRKRLTHNTATHTNMKQSFLPKGALWEHVYMILPNNFLCSNWDSRTRTHNKILAEDD